MGHGGGGVEGVDSHSFGRRGGSHGRRSEGGSGGRFIVFVVHEDVIVIFVGRSCWGCKRIGRHCGRVGVVEVGARREEEDVEVRFGGEGVLLARAPRSGVGGTDDTHQNEESLFRRASSCSRSAALNDIIFEVGLQNIVIIDIVSAGI